MDTLIFLALAILPPLIAGPLPAMLIFRLASGPNWKQRLPLAILLAIVLNLVAGLVIIFNWDGLLPAGFFACSLTPIAAAATLLASFRQFRQTSSATDADALQRRWLRLSLIAVSALQIFTATLLVLAAPALCTMGIRTN